MREFVELDSKLFVSGSWSLLVSLVLSPLKAMAFKGKGTSGIAVTGRETDRLLESDAVTESVDVGTIMGIVPIQSRIASAISMMGPGIGTAVLDDAADKVLEADETEEVEPADELVFEAAEVILAAVDELAIVDDVEDIALSEDETLEVASLRLRWGMAAPRMGAADSTTKEAAAIAT